MILNFFNCSADSYSGSSYGGGGGGGSSGFSNFESSSGGVNALSVLVAPLAALALLGAAAAVSSSPVLLSMVVLSSGRKRRDLISTTEPELENQLQEMELLEKYIAKVPDHEKEQERLMATYLTCSGFTEDRNGCLDRIVCEYSVEPSRMPDLDKDVISMSV